MCHHVKIAWKQLLYVWYVINIFLSMEVDIEFPSLDTDRLLQTHPLTARKEIEQEVVRIAKETMSPIVTKTISNIAFFKVHVHLINIRKEVLIWNSKMLWKLKLRKMK